MCIKFDMKLEKTRQRLREWGYWYHRLLTSQIGYPAISLLGKIADSKGMLIRSTVYVIRDNPEAEEIDLCINNLAHQEPMHASLVKIHYAFFEEIDEKIKSTALSRTSYFRFLREAEEIINSYLHSS